MDHPPSGSSVSSNNGAKMTREDLLSKGPDWNLACDNALLLRLQDFSENLIKSSNEVAADCEFLSNNISTLQFKLSNVTNEFLMLGNSQFVENCVQEFNEECNLNPPNDTPELIVPQTKAEKESALIEKMKEAIQIGINVQQQRDNLRSAELEESTASTSSRFSSSVNLAHLIGSSKFFSSKYCGLRNENRYDQGNVEIIDTSSTASTSSLKVEATTIFENKFPTNETNQIYHHQPPPIPPIPVSKQEPPPTSTNSNEIVRNSSPSISNPPLKIHANNLTDNKISTNYEPNPIHNHQPAPPKQQPPPIFAPKQEPPPNKQITTPKQTPIFDGYGDVNQGTKVSPSTSTSMKVESSNNVEKKMPSNYETNEILHHQEPPPIQTSIFDSSDSDDDLFFNASPGKAYKAKPSFNSSVHQNARPFKSDIRPPPVLDLDSDSDSSDDIFKALNSRNDKFLHSNRISPPPPPAPSLVVQHKESVSSHQHVLNSNVQVSTTPHQTQVVAEKSEKSLFEDSSNAQASKKSVVSESEKFEKSLFDDSDSKVPASTKTSKKPSVPAENSEKALFEGNSHVQESKKPVVTAENSEKSLFEDSDSKVPTPTALKPTVVSVQKSGKSIFEDNSNAQASKKPVVATEKSEQPLLKDSNSKIPASTTSTTTSKTPLGPSTQTTEKSLLVDNSSAQAPKKPVVPESKKSEKSLFDDSGSDSEVPASTKTSKIPPVSAKKSEKSLFGDNSNVQVSTKPVVTAEKSVKIPASTTSITTSIKPIGSSAQTTEKSLFGDSDSDSNVPPPTKTSKIPSVSTSKSETPLFVDNSIPPAFKKPVTSEQKKSEKSLFDDSDSDSEVSVPTKILKKPSVSTPKSQTPLFVDNLSTPAFKKPVASEQKKSEKSLFDDSDSDSKVTAPTKTSSKKPLVSVQKSVKSIFESSDSDDDLFSTSKTKPPITGNKKQNSTTVVTKQSSSLFNATIKKSPSLFNDDSENETDDLFSSVKKSTIKVNTARHPVSSSGGPDFEKAGEADNSNNNNKNSPSENQSKRFSAVAKSLENIFSTKGFSISTSSTITSKTITDAVSFDDEAFNRNLLPCMTKNRPKIAHRRPPSLAGRHFSKSLGHLHMPNAISEELDPFA